MSTKEAVVQKFECSHRNSFYVFFWSGPRTISRLALRHPSRGLKMTVVFWEIQQCVSIPCFSTCATFVRDRMSTKEVDERQAFALVANADECKLSDYEALSDICFWILKLTPPALRKPELSCVCFDERGDVGHSISRSVEL